MKEEISKGQNEIKEDMRRQLEEQGDKFDKQVSEIITTLKTEVDTKLEAMEKEMDTKLESVEKVVEENSRKVQDFKQEISKEITTMREEINKIKSQHESFQTHGNIKNEECHVSSTKIKPPTYDGKTSWQTYMKQFEAAASVNRWTDSEKATALIVSLRGEALEVLQTLSEDKHKDYDDLVQHLEMRFGDKHLQQVYQAQLRGRIQRSNETLQQYEADIARLVYLAYPSAPAEFIEQLAVQVFIDGVRDCETQQALRLARCKKLNEVLAYALEFEAAKQASQRHSRVRQIRTKSPNWKTGCSNEEINSLKAEMESLQEKLTSLQNRQDQGRQNTTFFSRRNIKCWNCGEEGHIRPRCPKPVREEGPVRREVTNQENSN